MAFLGAALLAALRASSPSSFGSPAALALVGRLLLFLPASGAGLLVSLGPAVMSFQVCINYPQCVYSTEVVCAKDFLGGESLHVCSLDSPITITLPI